MVTDFATLVLCILAVVGIGGTAIALAITTKAMLTGKSRWPYSHLMVAQVASSTLAIQIVAVPIIISGNIIRTSSLDLRALSFDVGLYAVIALAIVQLSGVFATLARNPQVSLSYVLIRPILLVSVLTLSAVAASIVPLNPLAFPLAAVGLAVLGTVGISQLRYFYQNVIVAGLVLWIAFAVTGWVLLATLDDGLGDFREQDSAVAYELLGQRRTVIEPPDFPTGFRAVRGESGAIEIRQYGWMRLPINR